MKTAEQLKFLEANIDKLVSGFKRDSARAKRTALWLRIASAAFAALITVLLGLSLGKEDWEDLLRNVALGLGAVITVLSAYEAFFDPRAIWIRERVTFARLKDLQRDLSFWSSGHDPEALDPDELEIFKQKLDLVLSESLNYWMKIRGAPDIEAGQTAAQIAEAKVAVVPDQNQY